MKLTSSGLLNDSNTTLVTTSGNALTATYAKYLLTSSACASIIKCGNCNNGSLGAIADGTYIYMTIDNEGLNLTCNFKLDYTFTMRNRLYCTFQIIFQTTNSVDTHSFILTSKRSNKMEDIQAEYSPPAGKWVTMLTFVCTGQPNLVYSLSNLAENVVVTVPKFYTTLLISSAQSYANLESTHIAETKTWPRIIT